MSHQKSSLEAYDDWPLSRVFLISDVSESEVRVRIETTSEERARLAAFAQVAAIETFFASFSLSRNSDGVYFRGEILARAQLVCVATLDVFSWDLKEEVSGVFTPIKADDVYAKEDAWDKLPCESKLRADASRAESAVEDSAFPVIEGKIDLGRCAAELFYVATPLYPRKPDAIFSHEEGLSEISSPFSILSKLK